MTYSNSASPYYSETTRQLTDAEDWTERGMTRLTLWFRGLTTNAAAPLYVVLADSAGASKSVAQSDSAAIQVETWTAWDISLDEFSGVNLTAIKKLTIGVGSRTSPTPGPSGKVYIDDIELH